MLEKTYKYGIDTYHVFIDFKSAYDRADKRPLYNALAEFNIPVNVTKSVQMTLLKFECRGKVHKNTSRTFVIPTGPLRVESLSCLLLNIVL